MKIIIPMAGVGKRMRPHTFNTPKPLIPVAGKPIVQWLIEELLSICKKPVSEIAFIIGDFGKETEDKLIELTNNYNINGKIYYQRDALGTAHAIYCAEPSLDDEIIVAFADTIFFANFDLSTNSDSIIWVKKVDNPTSFGVVKVNKDNLITDFIEKPKEFVSDLAIIGIYYFKDGRNLKHEIKCLLDSNYKVNGEFQLTDALENLKIKGFKFSPGIVNEWLDCGNKHATLETNRIVLKQHFSTVKYINTNIIDSLIINPCFIHDEAEIKNSIIGPFVSIGPSTKINDSIIKNSMIFNNTLIENITITDSIIGSNSKINGKFSILNSGDFTVIQ